jgi:hypothetical protein
VLVWVHVSILHDLAHLGIQESVSDDHFLLLQVLLESFALERQIIKVEAEGS